MDPITFEVMHEVEKYSRAKEREARRLLSEARAARAGRSTGRYSIGQFGGWIRCKLSWWGAGLANRLGALFGGFQARKADERC
jgi:hypothetical protein